MLALPWMELSPNSLGLTRMGGTEKDHDHTYGKEREVEALRARPQLLDCSQARRESPCPLLSYVMRARKMAQGKSRTEHVEEFCRLLRGTEIVFFQMTNWLAVQDDKERMKY
jgi:hypothetical protein